MTRMAARLRRLEHAYAVDRQPADEGARTARRLNDLVHLVPTAALRLLLETATPGCPAVPLSPAHEDAEWRLGELLDTGTWLDT